MIAHCIICSCQDWYIVKILTSLFSWGKTLLNCVEMGARVHTVEIKAEDVKILFHSRLFTRRNWRNISNWGTNWGKMKSARQSWLNCQKVNQPIVCAHCRTLCYSRRQQKAAPSSLLSYKQVVLTPKQERGAVSGEGQRGPVRKGCPAQECERRESSAPELRN